MLLLMSLHRTKVGSPQYQRKIKSQEHVLQLCNIYTELAYEFLDLCQFSCAAIIWSHYSSFCDFQSFDFSIYFKTLGFTVT